MRDFKWRWGEMLPIVTRELRVAAKRRLTYRLRFIVAFLGGLQLILCSLFLSGFSVQLGQTVFWLTSMLAALLCAGAGLVLTADCISREKRDETLGLLFLTRLSALDVILGKFTVGFLSGASVAFATFPFLAFSLCLGGVTALEFWLISCFLFFLLIFSLTLGVFISTLFRSESMVALAFFIVMFVPAATLPLVIMKWKAVPLFIARWNPLYPIFSLMDERGLYFDHQHVVPVLIFQGFLVMAMFALSCLILPWVLQTRPVRSKSFQIFLTPRIRQKARRPLLDSSPVAWLSSRRNHPLILLYFCIAARLTVGLFTTVPFEAEITYIVLLAVFPKVFVLWQASGMIADERQSGFLETLLTTPMPASEILHGKTRAIQRQVWPALLFALAVQFATSTRWWAAEQEIPVRTTVVLGVMITVLIDVHCAAWIGLWQGLLARDRRRALIRSFVLGIFGPWIPAMLFWFTIAFAFDPRWMNSGLLTVPPSVISANVISFALACIAMARLHDNFRSTAVQNWTPRRPIYDSA